MTRRILHRMYHQCGNTDTCLFSLPLPLLHLPLPRPLLSTPCPGISAWSNPPTRPRPYRSSISFASTSSSCCDLSLLTLSPPPPSLLAARILFSPFPTFDDHLFGLADAALPANLPTVEFMRERERQICRCLWYFFSSTHYVAARLFGAVWNTIYVYIL